MSTFYSNLYGQFSGRGTTSTGVEQVSNIGIQYNGPSLERQGEIIVVRWSFTNTTATPFTASTTDQLIICPLPKSARLHAYSFVANAVLDTDIDFEFNFGFTGSLSAYLAASTGLQATNAVTGTPSGTAGPTTNGANIILSASAGELEAAGKITGFFEIIVP